MDAGVTTLPSILNQPLTQLTEEDISQLTREDCRKYLKEKGMRRPSWNKSQAIQQVISLKALFETSAGACRSILVSKRQSSPSPSPSLAPATLNSSDSVKEAGGDAGNNFASDSVEGTVPGRVNDSPKWAQLDSQAEEADYDFFASRSPGAAHGTIGQLTIFYCGKVNVYDGVPPDKARAIMHLAASPIQVSLDDTISRTRALPFPCHLRIPSNKPILVPSGAAISPFTQTEGQASRKVSLQRYLDKRKDRERFKVRKCLGPTYSSLDVYLNHRLKTHASNGQSTHCRTRSPTQPAVQHALYISAENDAKSANFSVDLNEDVLE